MYDSVSRGQLEPGTELVPPEADHSWRIQLHRDNIADYVDIPSPEREYISSWDAFSLPRGLSSEVYFPGMFVDYMREKAPWLVASGQRMEEFLKHLASLQLRGVLEQSTMEEVLEIIGEAREANGARMEVDGGEEAADPNDWQAGRRVENCVVCGQAAATIVCILVCSNKVSPSQPFPQPSQKKSSSADGRRQVLQPPLPPLVHTRHGEDGPPRGRLALRRLRARRRDAIPKGRLARHRIACVRSAAIRESRTAGAAPLPGQEPGGEDQGSKAGRAEASSWVEGRAREVNIREWGGLGIPWSETGELCLYHTYWRWTELGQAMASLRSGVSGFSSFVPGIVVFLFCFLLCSVCSAFAVSHFFPY